MLYNEMYMGGVLVHGERSHKYIDKIRTKTGKWRYIYKNTLDYGNNKRLRDKFANEYNNKVIQDKIEVNPTYWAKRKFRNDLENYYNNKTFNQYLRYIEGQDSATTNRKAKFLNEEGRNINDQIKKDVGYFNKGGGGDSYGLKERNQKNRVSTKGQGDYSKLRLAGEEDWYKATSKKYQKKMDDSIQGITKRKYYKAKAKVGKALNKLKKKH